MSNLVVDSRPCKDLKNIPLPVFSVVDETLQERVLETAGPGLTAPFPVTAEGKPNIKKKFVPKPRPKPKVRSEFPETWLWTEETVDEKTGEKIMEVKIPDTITTWYASGFAISDRDGLGVANPAEIRGFKAVFVSVNLPYSVIRGEMVTIPVVAFNYLDVCLNVRMSMKVSKDFKSRTRNYANVCLCAGRSATVMFKIIAQKLGRINIEATAESVPKNNCPSFVSFDPTTHIDIVRKKLLVEPEGIEEEYTWNSLVCPNDKTMAEKAKLEIPANVVPESVYSELRVIGDLMGPSLSNIDSLLKMPYGCGEQNMLNFAPNIFIMQYLKATNQLTEAIKDKATGYTLQGYQRELSYKHSDGSYSAFGDRDPEGSMWLTAFVLKSFAEARDFIEIDKKIMTEAKRWILRKQSRDGCFPTVGSLHNKAMKGGVKTPVTLTGYVVLSLLEAGMPPKNSHIARAINRCIVPELKNINDTYSLTILSYTLMKAGRQQELNYLLKRLEKAAIKKDGTRHWEEQKPKVKKAAPISWWSPPYYQASSADIEMSAYALMALVPEGDKAAAVAGVDIVKWLSQQRNSLGGWSSTQDTVLAMQALAKFAAIVHGGKLDLKVDVSVPELTHQFIVNNENTLVLQRIQIPPKFPTVLKLHATGKGCALLSASVKYNVKDKQKEPSFALSVNLEPLKSNKKMTHGRCRSQRMNIRAKWLKDDTSNMAIISVKMLSGFEPTTDSLDKAVFRDPLLKEYEKKGKAWVFYYSRIKDVSLSFKVKQTRIVQNMKASSVTVYDYYDTDKSATVSYDVTKKMCA